jgi:2-polyprenyl-6-methoxyphenol hydroxylase-like FAD-dependent oxidoreductase
MSDVLIIGAGPAGAVAAAILAQKGHEVLVLERQAFPRFSIGESLLANSMQLLSEAGMSDAVMRCGFQYKNGAAFVCDQQYSEFNFVDKVTAGYPFTFQVPRADFDQVLINEAARFGARVRYEVEITGCDVSGERPVVTSKDSSGNIETHRPRFVLDASGFGRTLPRLLNLEKPSSFPTRAALFCHIKDNIVAGAFDRQKIRVGINPTQRDIWFPMATAHSASLPASSNTHATRAPTRNASGP